MTMATFSINSYGGVTVTDVEVELDLDEFLDEVDSDSLRAKLDERGELMDTDEMISTLINDNQERAMLEEMDNGNVVEILGADELLAEMDEDTVVDYCRNNGLINDVDHIEEIIVAKQLPELVDALMGLGQIDDLLHAIDSEFIQKHLENLRGGLTLENVPTQEMIDCLENERDVRVSGGFTLSTEVVYAIQTLNDFTKFLENSKGGYEGKRFAFPEIV
jgi:hypothetical protein